MADKTYNNYDNEYSASEKNHGRSYLLINEKCSFAAKEAYKSARTNLIFLLKNEENRKAVLVTSPSSFEGKTTTCANLAITFAQANSKVVLVDADMRKPQLHRAFNVWQSPGLSETLAEMTDENTVYKTSIENLYVVPSGTIPPDPTELLMSRNFTDFIEKLEEEFDYVFVDVPPIGIVTDAAIVASKGINTVLVARKNSTVKDALTDARQAIEQAGGKVIGLVFNDADAGGDSYKKYRYKKNRSYRYYRYGGYGYGGYGNGGYSSSNRASEKPKEE